MYEMNIEIFPLLTHDDRREVDRLTEILPLTVLLRNWVYIYSSVLQFRYEATRSSGVEGVSFLNAYRQISIEAILVPVVPDPIVGVLHP